MIKTKFPNVLFIIGNGFDLAHGMRTSYKDFLLWYLNEINAAAITNLSSIFEDELVKFENKFPIDYKKFEDFKEFEASSRQNRIQIEYRNELIEELVKSCSEKNWVDIEYTYFQKLIRYYKFYEKHGEKNLHQVERINACLDEITVSLVKYLKTIKFPGINRRIYNSLWSVINYEEFKNACFLIFNYTDTVEYYLTDLELKKESVINIHGQLNNKTNPIIFGYGDEMFPYYSKIEDLNENEYLRHMKSFGYFKTSNYLNLLQFIDSNDFTVCIMGHSCGLSDRVLLNTIFCHESCKEIQIFYHQKGPNSTDFVQKTMEISRHFKADDKAKMREKIISLELSNPLS